MTRVKATRSQKASHTPHAPTGITGLDAVFLGGPRRDNVILVEGGPGTGKTTLGMEFIYRGGHEFQEPGLIVTFELSPQKLLRDASGFGWDFADLEKRGLVKIIYTSPSVLLNELQSNSSLLQEHVASLGAQRLLVDGLAPLRSVSERLIGRPFRENLYLLVESLQRMQLTALLTREVRSGDGSDAGRYADERYVCDTIIALGAETPRRSLQRSLTVVKSRGQDYISGRHSLRITAGRGIEVFRRAQSRPKTHEDQPTSGKRSSVGCAGIDKLMGGGVYDGSITLNVGISGTGKTVTGLQFLMAGVQQGKRGLLVTTDEHPLQIERNAQGMGMDFRAAVKRGDLLVYYASPMEIELDEHFDAIVRRLDSQKASRVVIDSLAAYEMAQPEEARDFVYALCTYFKNRLVTVMMSYESPELMGISQISENLKASHLVDNIILLSYVEISNQLRRAITIPKARGANNIRHTREFVIGHGGISLVDQGESAQERVPQLPFNHYYGLLARSPARKGPAIENHASPAEAKRPRKRRSTKGKKAAPPPAQ